MYLNVFQNYIEGLRESGGSGQFIGRCPFSDHTDNKASFCGNCHSGMWKCQGCGRQGNMVTFAKEMNIPNPNQFATYDNVTYVPPPTNPPPSKEDLDKKMEWYRNNLKENLGKWKDVWDKDLIDDLNIGLNDNGVLVFAQYDKSGKEIVAIKTHKKGIIGQGKSKWYPSNKITSYKPDKEIVIVEGEIDEITLLSHLFQAITGTTGANSIPKDSKGNYDLKWLGIFIEIIIAYDNDDAGIKGALKIANEILKVLPNQHVSIIQWDKDLPNGFDVTDAFEKDKDATEFYKAYKNRKVIEPNNNIGGLELITGLNAQTMVVPPQRQIIDNIMPEKANIVFGGTTNSNKSYCAMQMGMAIANNESSFLGFNINLKNQKVLLFDTECGKNELVRRYQRINQHFPDWKGNKNFNLVTKTGSIQNIYDEMEKCIERLEPDIVIIDCLYNTTDGEDISKNHHIKPILLRIERIRDRYDVTTFSVHHFNKGGHQEGLIKDRISGGSALQNWAEHIVLLTQTNDRSLRLLKIDKSRHIDYPNDYFVIEWDAKHFKLNNIGVSTDWRSLLITADKKYNWESVLERLQDKFSTTDFKNIVECEMGKSERTATYWLKDMVSCNVIVKVGHAEYQKKLKVISSNEGGE